MIKSILFVLSLALYAQGNDECDSFNTFYDDLRCKPMIEKDAKCPSQYDCSHIDKIPEDKCLYHGKLYNKNENLPEDETYADCNVACRCTGRSQNVCAILDCPEWLGNWPSPGCQLKYELGKCCAVGNICPPFDKVPTCKVGDKTYMEGERFGHPTKKCTSCVCHKDFKGEVEDKFCRKNTCSIEIRNSEELQKKCAAVYRKNDCCPYEFFCPTGQEKILKAKSVPSPHLKCKYGEQTLNIGDSFDNTKIMSEFEKSEIKCECLVPPFVTCIKTQIFDIDKAPEHLKPFLSR